MNSQIEITGWSRPINQKRICGFFRYIQGQDKSIKYRSFDAFRAFFQDMGILELEVTEDEYDTFLDQHFHLQAPTSRLLQLPTEIRQEIYKTIFTDACIKVLPVHHNRTAASDRWRQAHSLARYQIVLTCRQAYEEARDLYYGTALWDLRESNPLEANPASRDLFKLIKTLRLDKHVIQNPAPLPTANDKGRASTHLENLKAHHHNMTILNIFPALQVLDLGIEMQVVATSAADLTTSHNLGPTIMAHEQLQTLRDLLFEQHADGSRSARAIVKVYVDVEWQVLKRMTWGKSQRYAAMIMRPTGKAMTCLVDPVTGVVEREYRLYG